MTRFWTEVDDAYLLNNVPHGTDVLEKEKAVGGGDRVERGFLFVAEEHVRRPDLSPHVVLQLHL